MRVSLEDLNTSCKRCGGLVPYWGDSCTRCGHLAHPPHRLRIMGGIYLVLGLGLCGAIGYLMVLIAGIMKHSGDPGATVRFNGTPLQAVGIFAILWVVMLIGFTVLVTGIWQIRYGRRNVKLVRIAMFWYVCISVVSLTLQLNDLWRLARFG